MPSLTVQILDTFYNKLAVFSVFIQGLSRGSWCLLKTLMNR